MLRWGPRKAGNFSFLRLNVLLEKKHLVVRVLNFWNLKRSSSEQASFEVSSKKYYYEQRNQDEGDALSYAKRVELAAQCFFASSLREMVWNL